MVDAPPSKQTWTAIDAMPLAILGLEVVLAAGLFAVGAVFILTVYWAFVAVSVWRVALWVAVPTNAAGALVAVARLTGGGRGGPGVAWHALGLIGNAAAMSAAVWALSGLG